MEKNIVIKNASENNLKNINLTIPRNKLVVFTGVSGSGKSTLAFDTIYAEGQRKFMESLSSYARQFLGQMKKPKVESISGLSPSISIDQKTTNHNPRSTVGTVTEIYDYLRLLFANVGTPHCPHCHTPVKEQTAESVVESILQNEEGAKLLIKAPLVRGAKGSHENLIENLKSQGYSRVQIDGENLSLDDEISLDKNLSHTISVVVDRVIVKKEVSKKLYQSVELCLNLAKGLVEVECDGKNTLFNTKFACATCGFSFGEISPRLFSFNNPFGACPQCSGLGFKKEASVDLVVKDWNLTLNQGAISITGWNIDAGSIISKFYSALAKKYKFSLDVPLKDLPKKIQNILFYGNDGELLDLQYKTAKFSGKYQQAFEGVIPLVERRYRETSSEMAKLELSKYMLDADCTLCHGKRLNEQALSVFINNRNIADFCALSVVKLLELIENLKLTEFEQKVADSILKEIKARLKFLEDVGLSYLTLARSSGTLSGGESQRIRLATQIGSGLVGVVYILDEPSIGLHQRDNEKLIATLKSLRDMGNTVIVVEHDDDTILASDYVVDIGPFAGEKGGEVVAQGTVEQIKKNKKSLTGKFLSGELKIDVPTERREIKDYIKLYNVRENNLKNLDVKIPLRVLTAVTGVSGSGKSSLVNGVFTKAMMAKLVKASTKPTNYDKIEGWEDVDKIIEIDQSPIGRTPRSNPATYTGVFTIIRELFASTPEAKRRNFTVGRFSFNVAGGRCEHCQGDGIKKIEMFFLPDVFVPCEVCGGKRYNSETLKVLYKGKSIYNVLDMTIEEAYDFFENIPKIKSKLEALVAVGLGYIRLGQSSTTLSGGEAQRVKLATELSKRNTGNTLYILDEPTTGLHNYDVAKLAKILQKLVSLNNTVVVVEHNLDIIKQADYIIDLGPEGGDEGGNIVAEGTPEQVASCEESHTGKFLKNLL